MATANLNKSDNCINWNTPFQILLKIPLNVSVVNNIYFIKNSFWNFHVWGLKGWISIDADSGPLRYILWCCGSRHQEEFTFIQIGLSHTVSYFGQRIFYVVSLLEIGIVGINTHARVQLTIPMQGPWPM